MVNLQDTSDKIQKQTDRIVNLYQSIYRKVKPIYMVFMLFALHWFSCSGMVYNMINNAPPYGTYVDKNGMQRTRFLASGSSQYATEGMVAGLLTVATSIVFILALRSTHKASMPTIIMLMMLSGVGIGLIWTMYKAK